MVRAVAGTRRSALLIEVLTPSVGAVSHPAQAFDVYPLFAMKRGE